MILLHPGRRVPHCSASHTSVAGTNSTDGTPSSDASSMPVVWKSSWRCQTKARLRSAYRVASTSNWRARRNWRTSFAAVFATGRDPPPPSRWIGRTQLRLRAALGEPRPARPRRPASRSTPRRARVGPRRPSPQCSSTRRPGPAVRSCSSGARRARPSRGSRSRGGCFPAPRSRAPAGTKGRGTVVARCCRCASCTSSAGVSAAVQSSWHWSWRRRSTDSDTTNIVRACAPGFDGDIGSRPAPAHHRARNGTARPVDGGVAAPAVVAGRALRHRARARRLGGSGECDRARTSTVFGRSRAGRPLVVWQRILGFNEGIDRPGRRAWWRLVCRRTDAAVALTPEMGDELRALRLPRPDLADRQLPPSRPVRRRRSGPRRTRGCERSSASRRPCRCSGSSGT